MVEKILFMGGVTASHEQNYLVFIRNPGMETCSFFQLEKEDSCI